MTADQKPEAMKHFDYEVWMLDEAARRIVDDPSDKVMNNAYVESFAVHARTVYQFFYPTANNGKGLADDITASDFLEGDVTWRNLFGEPDQSFQDLNRKANKHIAHLTMERLRPEAKLPWKINEYHSGLMKQVAKFREKTGRQREAPDSDATLQIHLGEASARNVVVTTSSTSSQAPPGYSWPDDTNL